MADERLRIIIEAVDQASGSLKRIGETFVAFVGAQLSVAGLRRGFSELTEGIQAAVAAASEQAEVDVRLEAALRLAGDASGQFADAAREQAAALQLTTRFSDEAIERAQALLASLAGLTGEGLRKATLAAVDLSEGLGTDLSTAATQIAKVVDGSIQTLLRFDLGLDETATRAERLAAVLGFAQRSFGDFGQQIGATFSGRLAEARNQFGELLEALGRQIVQSPAVVEALRGVTEIFNTLSQQLSGTDLSGTIKDVTIALARLVQTAAVGAGVASGVKDFVVVLTNLGNLGFGVAGGLLSIDDALKFVKGGASDTTRGIATVIVELSALIARLEATPASAGKAKGALEGLAPPAVREDVAQLRRELEETAKIEAIKIDGARILPFGEVLSQMAADSIKFSDNVGLVAAKFVEAQDPATAVGIALGEAGSAGETLVEFMGTFNAQLEAAGGNLDLIDEDLVRQAGSIQANTALVGLFASGFAQLGGDIVAAAIAGEKSFGQFFRQFFIFIARAIAQALILAAILSFLPGGGGTAGFALNFAKALGGGQQGGLVTGGRRGRDSVLSLLEPGEVVVRAPVVQEVERRLLGGQDRGGPVGGSVAITINEGFRRGWIEELVGFVNRLAEFNGLEVVSTRTVS